MGIKLFARRLLPWYLFVSIPPAATVLGGIAALLWGTPGIIIALACTALSGLIYLWFLARREEWNKEGNKVLQSVSEKTEIPPDRIDSLTGLANMNGFNAWFAEKAERLKQDNKAIIVLTADLANFQQLVKTRGGEQANAILREVARRISSMTGDNGIAVRVEGEEFVAIATVVPNKSLELAADQAGKLAEILQRPVELPTGVIWIGGSVGAATGSPLEGVLVFEKAKTALKKAKKIGIGHYFVDGLSNDNK